MKVVLMMLAAIALVGILLAVFVHWLGARFTELPGLLPPAFTSGRAIALVLERLDQSTREATTAGENCAAWHNRYSASPFEASRALEPGAWSVSHVLKAADTPWVYRWIVYEPDIVALLEKPKGAPC